MISALGITYNNESHIERFIKTLSFADEIIIIDAFSTDNTTKIAKSLGAKVIQRNLDDLANQKNFALEQAQYNWIVFFSPEENIPESLSKELLEVTKSNHTVAAYKVKRNFIFMGKAIQFGDFENDAVVRLFLKSKCHFKSNNGYDELKVNGSVKTLKNKCEHNRYQDFDTYNSKLSALSKLQAQTLYTKNLRPNLFHFLAKPWFGFMNRYVLKLGFLDGKEGFILAYIYAFSIFKRYLYLWTMYRKIN